jgi:hypothetical protein
MHFKPKNPMKRRNLDLDECFRTETERYQEGSVALFDSVESPGRCQGTTPERC